MGPCHKKSFIIGNDSFTSIEGIAPSGSLGMEKDIENGNKYMNACI